MEGKEKEERKGGREKKGRKGEREGKLFFP